MTDHANVSDEQEEIASFVSQMRNSNTKRMTKTHVLKFTNFLDAKKQEFWLPEKIGPVQLDTYLASFFYNFKHDATDGDQIQD